MEATQRHLADIVGTTEQTLRLWEKPRNRKKAIPSGSTDRLLRALYAEYIGGDGSIRRMVERLAKLDQVEHARGNFRETDKR
jgi:putative transcriptional regulator